MDLLIITKRAVRLLILTVLVLLFLPAALRLTRDRVMPAFSGKDVIASQTIVIDAGHGGEDGGAVASDGTVESGINLEIAKRLELVFAFLGHNTSMTRREDVSIHSDDAETIRQKKVSDLKNRVQLVNGTPDPVLISIHQNSLPTVPSVHGAQVFFGKVEPGGEIAASIQNALNLSVNQGAEKKPKAIDPGIYLMKNVQCPAVLVECGFLSNAEETKKLNTSSYQTRLAIAVAAGFLAADQEPNAR